MQNILHCFRNIVAFVEQYFYICWKIFLSYIQQWMPLRSSGRRPAGLKWNKFTFCVKSFTLFYILYFSLFYIFTLFYICWKIFLSSGCHWEAAVTAPQTWNKFTSSPPPLGNLSNLSNLTWNSIGEFATNGKKGMSMIGFYLTSFKDIDRVIDKDKDKEKDKKLPEKLRRYAPTKRNQECS